MTHPYLLLTTLLVGLLIPLCFTRLPALLWWGWLVLALMPFSCVAGLQVGCSWSLRWARAGRWPGINGSLVSVFHRIWITRRWSWSGPSRPCLNRPRPDGASCCVMGVVWMASACR
ncbi:hypothetical protein ULF88_19520 [Halopseudomonas pachastrellae]|nr:hypothetical protein [Halopseudomonas pachastrellae]